MRALLALFLTVSVSTTAIAQDVVIYDSVNDGVRPAVDAATFLGYTVRAYDSTDIAGWIADVATGPDLVVFDTNSNYLDPQLASTQLDALEAYLNANPDGKIIVALWFMGFEAGHPLWPLMDIRYCSDFSTPPPLNLWVPGHPLWAGVPDPLLNSGPYGIDGAKVEVLGSALAVGGFSAGPEFCEAGVVVSGDCRSLYIGMTGRGGDLDGDSDGVRDWEELYRNAYPYMFTDCTGSTPTSETSWGAIKLLYR